MTAAIALIGHALLVTAAAAGVLAYTATVLGLLGRDLDRLP